MRIQVVEVIIGRLFLVLATLPLEVWASSASSGSSRHGRSTTTTTSPTATTTSRSSTTRRGRDGIPRSRRSSSSYSLSNGEVGGDDHDDHRWMVYPPWNPSRNISDDGFISGVFERIPGEWETEVRLRTAHTLNTPCRIRQVPGDGNCLFHSISLCLCHAENGTHWNMKTSLEHLYENSQALRQQAVACLRGNYLTNNRQNNNNNINNHHQSLGSKRLVLQGQEWVHSRELVEAAARQYGLTSEEYCQDMLQESVWGGGPEIVALANVLKRPIHVYELRVTPTTAKTKKTKRSESRNRRDINEDDESYNDHYYSTDPRPRRFCLRRMACFGSPKFDHGGRRAALHILSADSRFPDIAPGKHMSDGNHFLAVFPIDEDEDDDDGTLGRDKQKNKRRKRLRGGSFFWGGGGGGAVFAAGRRRRTGEVGRTTDETDEEQLGPLQWMGGWWRRNCFRF